MDAQGTKILTNANGLSSGLVTKPLGANSVPSRVFRAPYGVHERYAKQALEAGGAIDVVVDEKAIASYSALDTFWIPSDESNETLLFWAARMLHLTEGEYDALKSADKNPESKALFKKISDALELAHHTSVVTFGYQMNHLPKKVSTAGELIALMRQTSRFQTDLRKVPISVDTCYLLGLTVASYEAMKHDAVAFEAEAAFVHDTLFLKKDSESSALFEQRKQRGVKAKEGAPIEADMYFTQNVQRLLQLSGAPMVARSALQLEDRGKRVERVVAKIGRVPNIRAKEIVKDALGVRLTVTPAHATAIASGMLDHFFSPPLNASDVRIENDGFFSSLGESELFRSSLADTYKKNLRFEKATQNTNSGGFAVIKILATINVPRAGDGPPVMRQIEVQLVPQGHSNEIRERHHAIYDLAQELELFTRLHVVCPEQIFLGLAERAMKKTGFSLETIIGYLEKRKALVMISSRLKDKHYYVHPGVYKRLANFPGLVVESLLEHVAHEAANKGLRSGAIAKRLLLKKLHPNRK